MTVPHPELQQKLNGALRKSRSVAPKSQRSDAYPSVPTSTREYTVDAHG